MRIAIYGRKLKAEFSQYVQQIFDLLKKNNIDFIVYGTFYNHILHNLHIPIEAKVFNKKEDVVEKIDYVFSLGGDGTILDAITWIGRHEIPIVGFNFGRLGFLASIPIQNIQHAIASILKGNYVIDKRTMLQLEANKPLFKTAGFALNECTIQRTDSSSMITVHAYLNDQHLNSYWVDGLIISTSTGSTGYSLSCGGPIIHPTSDSFIITPMAPHNLNVRPMIVGSDALLSFHVEGRAKNFLISLDSRSKKIDMTFKITLRKATFKAHLLRLNDSNFLNAIQDKLLWGFDQRN